MNHNNEGLLIFIYRQKCPRQSHKNAFYGLRKSSLMCPHFVLVCCGCVQLLFLRPEQTEPALAGSAGFHVQHVPSTAVSCPHNTAPSQTPWVTRSTRIRQVVDFLESGDRTTCTSDYSVSLLSTWPNTLAHSLDTDSYLGCFKGGIVHFPFENNSNDTVKYTKVIFYTKHAFNKSKFHWPSRVNG